MAKIKENNLKDKNPNAIQNTAGSSDIINRDHTYRDGSKRLSIIFNERGECEVINYPDTAKVQDEK